MMNHIVSFSSGLSSALCCDRVIHRFHDEPIEIIFMDTTIEDDDNYRFLKDMQNLWNRPITILKDGRNPYQVATDKQIIPNTMKAPCTLTLKINLFRKYVQSKYTNSPVTLYIGYDYTETHRIPRTKSAYEKYGWIVDFPLLWKPIEVRNYSEVCELDWGIEPPRMYKQGYTHANCSGICVKQGKGDWLRTLRIYPERYAQVEAWEQKMREHPKRLNNTIQRDQVGPNRKTQTLTLEQLRKRHESGEQFNLFNLDFHGGCVSCGIESLGE